MTTQASTSHRDTSLYQIGFQNYNNKPDLTAASDESNDSLGDDVETINADDEDVDLDNCDMSIPGHEQEHGDDLSDFGHDSSVSDRKRKRTHSNTSLNKAQLDDTEDIQNENNAFSIGQSSHVSDTHGPHKRSKIEKSIFSGKRISDELDSDDELMMEMREKGFSDRQIAEKLKKDGRVRYDEKSISTRIVRIRVAKAEKFDFLLEEGYAEWRYEDDKLLIQAYSLADIEINYEIERVRAWRFRKVSDYMRRLNKNALFSSKACRERYKALVEGTARIPTELDDDPEARRAEMEAHCRAREKTRLKEEAEKAEKKSRKAKKAEEAANKRAQREAKKAQCATQRAEKAENRAARAKEKYVLKVRRNAHKEQNTTQKARKTTRSASAVTTGAPPPLPNTTPVTCASAPATSTLAPVTSASASASTAPATPTKKLANNPTNTTTTSDFQPSKTNSTSNTTTTNTSQAPKTEAKSKAKSKSKDTMTAETPDPRSNLSLADLQKICQHRGIRFSPHSGKSSLLDALQYEDDRCSLSDLKDLCREKKLRVTGSKWLLKYRLALAAAQACESFREGGSDSGGGGGAAAGASSSVEEKKKGGEIEEQIENETEER